MTDPDTTTDPTPSPWAAPGGYATVSIANTRAWPRRVAMLIAAITLTVLAASQGLSASHAQHNLAAARTQLGATTNKLELTTTRLDTAQTDLAAARTQLTDARTSLSSAQSQTTACRAAVTAADQAFSGASTFLVAIKGFLVAQASGDLVGMDEYTAQAQTATDGFDQLMTTYKAAKTQCAAGGATA